MSERRFVIKEVPKVLHKNRAEDEYGFIVTEAELKRRIKEMKKWQGEWAGDIELLIHGTEKEGPVPIKNDTDATSMVDPYKRVFRIEPAAPSEQEWEKWAESMPSAPGEPWEWSNKMRNWLLAIPCRKRRKE